MAFLDNIKDKAYHFFLQQKLKQTSQSRKTPVGYEKARQIGILFDATNFEEKDAVTRFANILREERKKVMLLAYIDDTQDHSNFYFKFFNRKEITWYNHPKGPHVSYFLRQDFDYLINAHMGNHPALEYIATISRARIKLCAAHLPNAQRYDIMIESGKDAYDSYLKQAHFMMKLANNYDN